MTRIGLLRVIAALTAIVTALLLQGSVVAPLVAPTPVSLPAVLVAAVALVDGPGAGLALGFSAGLVADLTTRHPVGVLALAWLLVGVFCGALAVPRVEVSLGAVNPTPVRHVLMRDAVIAAVACAASSLGAALLLTALGKDGAMLTPAFAHLLPTLAGDAVLAVPVVVLARMMLRWAHLRAPAASAVVSAHG
ncbi:MAG TPA: hypothetical protein VGL26_01100 [Jatrophihabitans sp.]|jgi:hypothetical protein